MFKTFSILTILCACSVEQDVSEQQSPDSAVVKSTDSFVRGIASADRTIEKLENMNEDLIKYNYNLFQIFKAVTKCELDTTESCEELHKRYAKEYEEKHNTAIER
jgi:hypothetical protein